VARPGPSAAPPRLRFGHVRIFDSVGAAAFAERARIELRATGGHAQQHTIQTPDTLTAQEALIARVAGEGASNPEIAAQLFTSPATVAYHLRKVFTKLGVSSRSQLAPALPARQGTAGRAAGLIPRADPLTAAAVPACSCSRR
jgi:DNA-binding CsgD family transcriptional regulator